MTCGNLFSALGGGYSGAYVVRVQGYEGASLRMVVCKASKQKRLLDQEETRWKDAARKPNLPPGMIIHLIDQVQPAGQSLYYFTQSSDPGSTLENLCLESDGNLAFLDELLVPIKRLQLALKMGGMSYKECEMMRFTQRDLDRFEVARRRLIPLARQCAERGFLPMDTPSFEEKVAHIARELVPRWLEPARLEDRPLPLCEQHGDLNPRNLLYKGSSPGGPQLIDFARFGYWPLGYDLCRLELQLFLRVVDVADGADYFPEQIPKWMKSWRDLGAESAPGADGPNKSGVSELLLRFLRGLRRIHRELYQELTEEWRSRESQVAGLVRAYDATRIMSYADTSPWKQLWALLVAIEGFESAGAL
jgi:hypothetical protein